MLLASLARWDSFGHFCVWADHTITQCATASPETWRMAASSMALHVPSRDPSQGKFALCSWKTIDVNAENYFVMLFYASKFFIICYLEITGLLKHVKNSNICCLSHYVPACQHSGYQREYNHYVFRLLFHAEFWHVWVWGAKRI